MKNTLKRSRPAIRNKVGDHLRYSQAELESEIQTITVSLYFQASNDPPRKEKWQGLDEKTVGPWLEKFNDTELMWPILAYPKYVKSLQKKFLLKRFKVIHRYG